MYAVNRFARLLTASLVLLGLSTGKAASEPVVEDIRFGAHATKTRVVLDLNGPIDFEIFVLSDPYRVVVDLPEVTWRLSSEGPPKPALVSALRYGHFKRGISRLVLDVSRPVGVQKAFLLEPGGNRGYRVVIDLVTTTRSEVLKAQRRTASKLAARSPAPVPSPKPVESGDSRLVIVVDPGHGGVDPGAIGANGTWEKDIALEYARELRRMLRATGRYKVVLTRDGDIFLPLRRRIEIARLKGADLFVSLHADAIANSSFRGAHVYTLSEDASDAEAAALAAKENKADLIAGVDLSGQPDDVTNILIDLAQRETMNQSAVFARMLVDELRKATRVIRKSHRFAGFAVLKAPDVPSVLVELGYLSNPVEERLLKRPGHRRKLAGAIVRGIDVYFTRQQAFKRP